MFVMKIKYLHQQEANRWFYTQSRKNAEKYQQALKHFENEFDISINNVPSSLRSERKFPIKECGNVHQLLQKVIRNMVRKYKSKRLVKKLVKMRIL